MCWGGRGCGCGFELAIKGVRMSVFLGEGGGGGVGGFGLGSRDVCLCGWGSMDVCRDGRGVAVVMNWRLSVFVCVGMGVWVGLDWE